MKQIIVDVVSGKVYRGEGLQIKAVLNDLKEIYDFSKVNVVESDFLLNGIYYRILQLAGGRIDCEKLVNILSHHTNTEGAWHSSPLVI